jgi:hypothetical protein
VRDVSMGGSLCDIEPLLADEAALITDGVSL